MTDTLQDSPETVAIIGRVGRFPGAPDVEALWQVVLAGRDTLTRFRPDALHPLVPAELRASPHYVPARGVLEGADLFDAGFFGMNPREAEMTDPQQRLFLEACWEALEDAGYAPEGVAGLVGIYAGMANNTYFPDILATRPDLVERFGALQTMLANEKDYLTTRAAYKLGFTGPAVNVYTACSTSLVAVAEAYHSLLSYQCDLALAGGVTVFCPQERGYVHQEGAITSGDGHCRPFDAAAQGTVFSSGLGLVVLKRLSEALADGDRIHAVIRGVGLNNDGARRTSFSAPSVDGQAEAVALAQVAAGTPPETIGYLETHGTATALGDPIEIEALTQAFRAKTARTGFCTLGALKGNIGHLDAAAGVAGLIKATLVLQHGQLPPLAHFTEGNPRIDFAGSPFVASGAARPWPHELTPRRAGVSAFGTGGTNAHVVLEEAPAVEPSGPSRPRQALLLSARSAAALDAATERLADFLERHPDTVLADAAFTLQRGRRAFGHRRVVVARDVADAVAALRQRSPRQAVTREARDQVPSVAFMFPGQGAQYVGMGHNLYRTEPAFRQALDQCATLLQPTLGADLRDILYPAAGATAEAEERLRQTAYTQPALFSLGYALAALWRQWGVEPAAMIGHSVGEFVAACLAGVFSLEDALRLVATRGRLMQDLPPGAMLSIRLPAGEVTPRLTAECSLAAINGPKLCVASGPFEAIARLEAALTAEGVACKTLHTSHAFHSPMMDPAVEPFAELVRSMTLSAPTIPFVSTVTADWITDAQATDPAYWAGHLRATVRFAEGVATLWQDPDRVLLEVGPRATATTLARQQATDPKRQLAIASLGDSAEDDAEWQALLLALGQLWQAGVRPNWDAFYQGERRRRTPLPTYPFERTRYWVEPALPDGSAPRLVAPPEPTAAAPTAPAASGPPPDRRTVLLAEVLHELDAISGLGVTADQAELTLLELGFDSLLLTQVSLGLSKRFKVDLSFRQLLEELPTVAAVVGYLDASLPPDAFASVAGAAPAAPAALSGGDLALSGTESVQEVINQQLEIMRRQLEVLRSRGLLPSDAVPPALPAAADMPEPPAKPFGAAARIDLSRGQELTPDQQRWIEGFTRRHTARTAASKHYTARHRPHLADPRAVSGFSPALKELVYPVVVERALGARLWDLDGNEYLDVTNGFGSNFLGHAAPVVAEAVARRLSTGYAIGPQHPLAGEVAELMRDLTGHERVAFCNTGSEAVLGAMRVARTVSGRSTIAMFRDSYHGIFDEVVVRGGRDARSFPAAPGIPRNAVEEMLVLEYGAPDSLRLLQERGNDLAAVLVEPVQSRRLDLQPRDFLHQLRAVTAETGTALIFDEIITGFRTALGGAQAHFGVKADIATYGKVVGGGLPIGIIAGGPRFLDGLDGGAWQFGDDSFPAVGVTYFAGTFVRHPLALTAAHAVLRHLKKEGPALQERLNALTADCVAQLERCCRELRAPIKWVHFSSSFQLTFTAEAPFATLLFALLRDKGIYISEGRVWFLTTAHSPEDVAFLVARFREALEELMAVGLLPRADASAGNGLAPPGPAAVPSGTAPVAGARRGRDPDGRPGWYLPDPDRPGKYLRVGD